MTGKGKILLNVCIEPPYINHFGYSHVTLMPTLPSAPLFRATCPPHPTQPTHRTHKGPKEILSYCIPPSLQLYPFSKQPSSKASKCALFMFCRFKHRVHTEWQRPLSGIHSIMMEKLAQACEGGGCTPTPFRYIYHHVQICGVSLQLRGQIHTPYFYSTPICILCSYPCSYHRLESK